MIEKQKIFDSLPPEWPQDLMPFIQQKVSEQGVKIVVLDDDPTGTQTVRDVTVLTRWDVQNLTSVLKEPDAIVYILTNSRSYPLPKAQDINREIALNLKQASLQTGRAFTVVSRSDSTLRGHFPGEVEALIGALEVEVDGILIIPFFAEGGRFTIGDIHYVADSDWLTPASETEYAKDASFGYHHSDLRKWVSEKYQGRVGTEEVVSIGLEMLRKGGPAMVTELLMKLAHERICVVNAASYRDMEVFVAGLLQAEANGKRFIYRTAASFVRVRGGMRSYPVLTSQELGVKKNETGGLIIAGSYIRRSSEQIAQVAALENVVSVEISAPMLLKPSMRQGEIEEAVRKVSESLRQGKEALVYTSRELITGKDEAESLGIGRKISSALVEIPQRLEVRPAWVIAKGGITSSDVATLGMNVSRARVLGQILPGVPVWHTGEDSRWPGITYVVFPGNVGGADAIAQAVEKLRAVGRG